ncbi:hypothetical protein DV735_g2236, partial [Chaetothyriales sp. CBS 134920]
MCIAVLSTAHPDYKLIIINNRDEYINRPTAAAEWWPAPNEGVFGGRDLLRDVQGTWLGITRTGKVGVLTNYRESKPPLPQAVSRGAIIRKFLTEDVGPVDEFVRRVVNTGVARDAGGFTLVCGRVGERLAVISNRAADQSEVPWIAGGDVVQTVGLSNATFTDRSWPKVTSGEEMGEQGLIERLLKILHHDTLPRLGELEEGAMTPYLPLLPNSIFIPPIGRVSGQSSGSAQPHPLGVDGVYATQKETVVLVRQDGRVRFFERTLYDSNSNPIPLGEGPKLGTASINTTVQGSAPIGKTDINQRLNRSKLRTRLPAPLFTRPRRASIKPPDALELSLPRRLLPRVKGVDVPGGDSDRLGPGEEVPGERDKGAAYLCEDDSAAFVVIVRGLDDVAVAVVVETRAVDASEEDEMVDDVVPDFAWKLVLDRARKAAKKFVKKGRLVGISVALLNLGSDPRNHDSVNLFSAVLAMAASLDVSTEPEMVYLLYEAIRDWWPGCPDRGLSLEDPGPAGRVQLKLTVYHQEPTLTVPEIPVYHKEPSVRTTGHHFSKANVQDSMPPQQ